VFTALSTKNAAPYYSQIKQQIMARIYDGRLAPGASLPSIRSLAAQLKVSIITVKRAYEDLEEAGYLATYPGKGSFVADIKQDLAREQAVARIEDLLKEVLNTGRDAGFTADELRKLFEFSIAGK